MESRKLVVGRGGREGVHGNVGQVVRSIRLPGSHSQVRPFFLLLSLLCLLGLVSISDIGSVFFVCLVRSLIEKGLMDVLKQDPVNLPAYDPLGALA